VSFRFFSNTVLCAIVVSCGAFVRLAAALPTPLWINDIVQDVIEELDIRNPVQITTIVGERLKGLAATTADKDKRFFLDHLTGEGSEIEQWGAFRTHLARHGYVMLLEVRGGYLVLPHSGQRYRFDDAGRPAAKAFVELFGHALPADATPWVVEDLPGNPGGRSGWGWYSDAAVNLKGKLSLSLEQRCKIESKAKLAMIAVNETTHTVLFREFGFGTRSAYDWQALSLAMDNTPVSREGEINEFLSDVASVSSDECAFILVYDHLLDRYMHGTEDDHHLSGRFFRSRVVHWEKKMGLGSRAKFEKLLGKVVTADGEAAQQRAVKRVGDYLISKIVSPEFVRYVQTEYMDAGRRVLALLRD